MQHPIHPWKSHRQGGRVFPLKKDKEENDEGEDGEEEKIIWYYCLTGMEGVSDTHDGGLIEKNMKDFAMKNGRILEKGLEQTDLGVEKLPGFPTGDKTEETKEKTAKGKPKKAEVCQCRSI